MESKYAVGLIISICFMAGCNDRVKPDRLESCDTLKADDPKIIEFANKCAQHLRDLTIYEQPQVREDPDQWLILYKGKAKQLKPVGHHFVITVNRRTCECEVHGGK